MYKEFLLMLSLALNTYSATHVKYIAEKRMAQPYTPLPDIIHDYCPPIPSYTPDILLGILIYYTFWINDTLLEVERNINCFLYASLLRSIFIHATIFPTCISKPKAIVKRTLYNPIYLLTTTYSKLFLSTHDLMYSGHTLVFMLVGKMMNQQIIQYICPFTLVCARQHYTIDVCVSILVYNYIYHIILGQ